VEKSNAPERSKRGMDFRAPALYSQAE